MKTDLIRKILFISGTLFSLIGLFILLFADRLIGTVFIAVGLMDLTFSFILPKLIERQYSGSSDNGSRNNGQ
ncbi:MAG: hypothetical protein JXA49_03930 [Actinobacteria bacterium]|nr:hypothetical protein [Actinomycetota bacterium]